MQPSVEGAAGAVGKLTVDSCGGTAGGGVGIQRILYWTGCFLLAHLFYYIMIWRMCQTPLWRTSGRGGGHVRPFIYSIGYGYGHGYGYGYGYGYGGLFGCTWLTLAAFGRTWLTFAASGCIFHTQKHGTRALGESWLAPQGETDEGNAVRREIF